MKWIERFHKHHYSPWVVWGLGALFGLFAFLLQGTPSVMIPELMKTFQIDIVQIGVLTSSFFYTYIILQVPGGMAVDLWGPRRVLKVGFLVCSIAIGWFAYAGNFWEGQTARMIMGAACAPAIVSAFCLASRWFKPHLFPLLVALTELLALLGGVIGEGGVAFSVLRLGWRETMIIIALIGLVLTFLSLFFIHDYPDHDQPLHNGVSVSKTAKKTWQNFVSILSVKQIWLNGIYSGLVFGLFPALAALWGVPYISARYHVAVDIAASVASMTFLGACFGTLFFGWLAVKMHHRRAMMILGALIAFLISLSIIYIPDVSLKWMFGLFGLLGFFSSTYALAFALVGHLVKEDRKGVAMGFTNMLCIAFGAPLLQPLIGWLLKQNTSAPLTTYVAKSYWIAFSPLPICLFIAFILAFFIKNQSKKPAK